MERVRLEGVWQEFRPRSAHGNRRHRGPVKWALSDVSFSASGGEGLGVIGHNGSGKTTLLRTLAGVLQPTRGRCVIDGRVSSLIELTSGVNRDLTGRENIMLGGVLLGMTRQQVRERYDDIAAFSGLTESVLNEPLSAYSSGMGLRIAFSVIVHVDAAVLLVDEVLAVGDDAFQEICIKRVATMREEGATVIMASHDLEKVREFCDRVLVFHQGRLKFSGDPDKALERYTALGPDPTVPGEDS
jgi:ABC-type polysaccharide/polyol phosphate transport system ATPase subunit